MDIEPLSLALEALLAVLVAGIGASALGMWFADLFRRYRERREVERCLRAARSEGMLR